MRCAKSYRCAPSCHCVCWFESLCLISNIWFHGEDAGPNNIESLNSLLSSQIQPGKNSCLSSRLTLTTTMTLRMASGKSEDVRAMAAMVFRWCSIDLPSWRCFESLMAMWWYFCCIFESTSLQTRYRREHSCCLRFPECGVRNIVSPAEVLPSALCQDFSGSKGSFT